MVDKCLAFVLCVFVIYADLQLTPWAGVRERDDFLL